MNFLPRRFRPNPITPQAAAPQAIHPGEALRAAICAHLNALLAGMPRPYTDCSGLFGLLPPPDRGHALAGYTFDHYLSGALPAPDLALELFAQPQIMGDLHRTQLPLGASLVLPRLVRAELAPPAFHHVLASAIRRYLEDRVIFSPGPPPMPQLSAHGMLLLLAPEPQKMHPALAAMTAPLNSLGFWDQWLLRRMQDTQGWTLPPDAPTLPFVAWQPGQSMPSALSHALPAYWPSLLDLSF